ncbi:MAG: GNAT family N-acetyltransferase [Acidimicrobiales bacterium]|nr:GNAT family N-acetyltransferase [Acidimicrobiales bacterium]
MPAVRPATPADVPGAARALADAFRTDPVWRWLADERAEWTEGATRWFSAYLRHQLAHDGEVLVDEGVHGCAVWLPPSHWRGTVREGLALALPSARLFRTGLVRALRNLSAVERAHPKDPPHWYLGLLGTDPAHQGGGIGSALISGVLARCDEQGLGAYLESSKEENVPFYARHGFEVVAELRLGDGPTMWRMWRDPKG